MEDFIKRLEQILSHFDLTVSQFADTVGVQRSNMSHLLSGRNKPSLDFIMKIVENFPNINIYWLIYGQEPFLIQNNITPTYNPNNLTENTNTKDIFSKIETEDELKNNFDLENITHIQQTSSKNTNKEPENTDIENIKNLKINDEKVIIPEKSSINIQDSDIDFLLIFYKDGTFKKFHSR